MPDEDSHLAVHARSQAHDSRQKIAGMTRCGVHGHPKRFCCCFQKTISAHPE